MNLNRPDMTKDVKFKNYTNNFLQKDSNPTTMEVVTQTNAVKSPTDSPATTKLVYTVEEIAQDSICAISSPVYTSVMAFRLSVGDLTALV